MKEAAALGDSQAQENLLIRSNDENDAENVFKYISMLVKSGNWQIPLKYAVGLFRSGFYTQSFNYFTLISATNNPVALFYIGVMKFTGQGCVEDKNESYKIMKSLSEKGINKATEFLQDHDGQF